MNKKETVNIRGRFQAEALRVLREIPGLSVTAQSSGGRRRADAILRFAGRRTPIVVEFKQQANAATAWQLVHRARPKTHLLLIAGETTQEAREILKSHGVAVVDGLGNAHIELPGLVLHIEGGRRPRRRASTTSPIRLRGKAGVAAQALLLRPKHPWQVQDLAKDAELSSGLAHRVLARLEEEGVVAAEGTGPGRVRRVTNPTALLDLWVEENVERPSRTLGYLLAQTPRQLAERLAANLDTSGIGYAITGAAAASFVAPFVTAVPVIEVWVSASASPEELLVGARVDRVAEGQNVVFLQIKNDTPLAFREKTRGLWLANRFRLYSDLRRDPRRGREQADRLRREVIAF